VLAADPTNMQARQDFASGHTLAGNIYLKMGDAAAGLRYHRQALALNQAIAAADPNNLDTLIQRVIVTDKALGALADALNALAVELRQEVTQARLDVVVPVRQEHDQRVLATAACQVVEAFQAALIAPV
jgi:hypothetical protein